jgi:hypothetical protein
MNGLYLGFSQSQRVGGQNGWAIQCLSPCPPRLLQARPSPAIGILVNSQSPPGLAALAIEGRMRQVRVGGGL